MTLAICAQQVSNGWRGQQFSYMPWMHCQTGWNTATYSGLYRHFPDIELYVYPEVFNGVWDSLVNGRVDLAIGATPELHLLLNVIVLKIWALCRGDVCVMLIILFAKRGTSINR